MQLAEEVWAIWNGTKWDFEVGSYALPLRQWDGNSWIFLAYGGGPRTLLTYDDNFHEWGILTSEGYPTGTIFGAIHSSETGLPVMARFEVNVDNWQPQWTDYDGRYVTSGYFEGAGTTFKFYTHYYRTTGGGMYFHPDEFVMRGPFFLDKSTTLTYELDFYIPYQLDPL